MELTAERLTAAEAMEELREMNPEELQLAVRLITSEQVYIETCIHEAAHAVYDDHLRLPFEYVTVSPSITDAGELMPGHIRWSDMSQATRSTSKDCALACLAPQIALPLFGIQRSTAEAQEEFSGDEELVTLLLRYMPGVTRTQLFKEATAMMTNMVRLEIHKLAEELRQGKTLTSRDVRELFKTRE